MTDRELADAAVAALKKTTITYGEWLKRQARGAYKDVTLTEWWKALDALGKIGSAPPPADPPPQSYVTTWDSRASKFTSIDYAKGVSVPAGLEFVMSQPEDIRLVTDARFPGGKAWRVRQNWNSHNTGYNQGSDTHSAEIVFEPKRGIAENQVDWWAQSLIIDDFNLAWAWLIFSQLGYPRIWSAPGTLMLAKNNWSNPSGVPSLVFIRAAGTNQAEGEGTDEGQEAYVLRPVSSFLLKRLDIVAGVKWNLGHTGWWFVETRVDGGPWQTHVDVKNIATVERVASEPYPPPRPVVDKQGAYGNGSGSGVQGGSGGWPAGWEQTYLLRGLTRHPSRADAEASLA